MSSRYFKYSSCILIMAGFIITLKAQNGLCPPNLDFENGDFTNWVCLSGTVGHPGGVNTVAWTGTGQVNGRHTIISATTAGTDPYGGFPEICPNGSGYSVRLGNEKTGEEAESISYTYSIPNTLSVFSILFHYAIVLEDPGHRPEEQARFRARIIDLTTDAPLPCVNFDFVASSSLPGFIHSPVKNNIWFKDWTPISINLSNYIGRSIKLEFITSDCTLGGDFGYAYIDVNTVCNGAIGGSTVCIGDTSITMTAPYGFQNYKWYSDNTFTQTLSTTQSLTLTPTPVIGSIFPVVVEPHPGYGCNDTLYASISISAKPVSNAGPDTSICKFQQVQIGGTSTVAYSYSWTPVNQVNNPGISDPVAWNNPLNSTEFIVKTTDLLTGCFSYDTAMVSNIQVNTSITQNGNTEYCIGDPTAATLLVGNSSTSVQWYNSNNIIPGAISVVYQPPVSGNYWASVTQNGCTDSTENHSIVITNHPLPQAIFSPITDTGCVVTNSFLFTNGSSVSDGSSMSYRWKFSDGDLHQTQNVTKTFPNLGSYTVALITTTEFGCEDSTTGLIYIFPNGIPGFTWDSVCISRPVLFKNLSNESGWPEVNYSWTFNNGGLGSSLKDPLPIIYTDSGSVNVTLTMTIVGCENDSKSITKPILINKPANGIQYREITVPSGISWPVHSRDGIGNIYNWRPQIHLNDYSQRYTQFNAVSDDVKYFIDITDTHTCITTDTLQMLVLKEPGHYLPNAFTPNNDGLNDVITPYLVGMKSLKSFSIYNRWGLLIFYTTTYNKGWDGKFNGIEQPAGVYTWKLEFITHDNKTAMEKGTMTLIR